MFKKSRIKIVASIMFIMMLLLGGTLCVIYVTSYMDVYRSNQEMLERYISAYSQNGNPGQEPAKERDKGPDNAFHLAAFYSVAFFENGETISIDDNDSKIYSEEQLEEYALQIVERGREKGIYDNFVYRIENTEDYTLVVLMDNTIVGESITTLFKYTLLFGGIALVITLFAARFLAKAIVKPLEENFSKQKQFISDAGHELKTPVAVINTNAELLEKYIGENQWLSNIQFENRRMDTLIRQLLNLARTEQAAPNMAKVDFSRIVTGEVLPFESVAFEKGLQLSSDSVAEGIFVYGDGEQLGHLVSILLDNAMRHSVSGKVVCISLSVKHNKAVLTVVNEGQAIPKEHQKLIFERFYKVDYSRTGEDNHYGLGLAIARAIVQAHSGDISVSCGNGFVTFTAVIPIRHV